MAHRRKARTDAALWALVRQLKALERRLAPRPYLVASELPRSWEGD